MKFPNISPMLHSTVSHYLHHEGKEMNIKYVTIKA